MAHDAPDADTIVARENVVKDRQGFVHQGYIRGSEWRSAGGQRRIHGTFGPEDTTVRSMYEVTRILSAIEQGDPTAAERLLPLVYDELRKLAAAKMAREKPDQTLQATALVHEAYIRLVGNEAGRKYRDRSHFFASAATAMRRILVEIARAKRCEKRGGAHHKEHLDDMAAPLPDEELLALHEALAKLASEDPMKAQLVELRYFGGLTADQAADVLGISPSSADRHWAFARAWLQAEVRGR